MFSCLVLEKHPEKTFIGRIEKGFDFLGYHLRSGRLAMAQKTVKRFVERASRLYERKLGETFDSSRLGRYVQRWFRWARSGLSDGVVEDVGLKGPGYVFAALVISGKFRSMAPYRALLRRFCELGAATRCLINFRGSYN
jgi:hypothetical protein